MGLFKVIILPVSFRCDIYRTNGRVNLARNANFRACKLSIAWNELLILRVQNKAVAVLSDMSW